MNEKSKRKKNRRGGGGEAWECNILNEDFGRNIFLATMQSLRKDGFVKCRMFFK